MGSVRSGRCMCQILLPSCSQSGKRNGRPGQLPIGLGSAPIAPTPRGTVARDVVSSTPPTSHLWRLFSCTFHVLTVLRLPSHQLPRWTSLLPGFLATAFLASSVTAPSPTYPLVALAVLTPPDLSQKFQNHHNFAKPCYFDNIRPKTSSLAKPVTRTGAQLDDITKPQIVAADHGICTRPLPS